MSDFRSIGELVGRLVADLGIEISERDFGTEAGARQSCEFEDGDRPKSGEEDRPSRSPMPRGGNPAMRFEVVEGGRAGRTHAATTGRPAPPARLRLVMSESEHHAFSGMG